MRQKRNLARSVNFALYLLEISKMKISSFHYDRNEIYCIKIKKFLRSSYQLATQERFKPVK